MTVGELLQRLEPFQGEIALGLLVLPLLTYGLGALLQQGSRRLCRYLLAAAIYLTVVPGISMAVIVLYMLLVVRLNLLHELNLVLHALPIASMLATLWAASRLEDFDNIPAFERIQGLMLLVGLGFAALLFVHKLFIGLVFFARFEYLLLLFGGFLVLWRLAVSRLFRKPGGRPLPHRP